MRFLASWVLGAMIFAPGALAAPVDPYKVFDFFPDDVHPNLRLPPIGRVRAGTLLLQLEKTPLDAIRKRLGGMIRHTGEAAGASRWICFRTNNGKQSVIYWFISNDEMGGGNLTQVAIQGNPEENILAACSYSPAKLKGIDFGFPSVGASVADLTKHFGSNVPDAKGCLGYTYERPTKRPGGTVDQSVQYLIREGHVRTVSVSQVTSF